MPPVPEFDDDLTPLPFDIPRVEDLPMEVALMKRTMTGQAQVLRALKSEKEVNRRGFRNIWLALVGVAVTMFLAAAVGFVSVGQYMERIDNVADSQVRIEARIDLLR